MKIKFLTIIGLLFLAVNFVSAQSLSADYKVISVNKKVAEIAFTQPYNSPLENYIARINSWIKGEYAPLYSETIDYTVAKQRAKPYDKEAADHYLKSEIEEVIIYKDSAGLVLLKENPDADDYLVGFSVYENGKWLGTGDDLCFANNMNDATQYIEEKSVTQLERLRTYYRQQIVSTDTLAFVNYLKQNGKEPVLFLINSLKNNKIVIYGEQHFRKASWELLNELIQYPDFIATTGAVFMELSIDAQPYLDQYYNNNVVQDNNLIFTILQDEELEGWANRGMYDFLVNLWNINSKLPNGQKIKVLAADFPRPFYHNIISKEQYNELTGASDRNEYMANTIIKYLDSTNDKRNCLFVVGSAHAYKSDVLLKGKWLINGKSAAKLLCDKYGKDAVFSISTHAPIISNDGIVLGKTRKGLFDWVFANNGNTSIAFNLKNSPFGKEPFDVNLDFNFDIATGTYADNYDGYIFLCPLKEELAEIPLFEMYTDTYITEIKRRAAVLNCEDDTLFGIKLKDLTCQTLIDKMKLSGKRKKWNFETE